MNSYLQAVIRMLTTLTDSERLEFLTGLFNVICAHCGQVLDETKGCCCTWDD